MKVELLEMTANPEEIIYSAARQCYSEKDAYEIFIEAKKIKKDKIKKFINEIVSSGHESVLEHVKFTFAISGVSRALTHQLIRHRIASYSQQSQRYVNMENFNYIIPPSIKNDKNLLEIYQNILNEIKEAYEKIEENDIEYFKISSDYGIGIYELLNTEIEGCFLKGQISGPITFLSIVKDTEGRSLIFNEIVEDIFVKVLGMKGLWLAKKIEEKEKIPIIFYDEPVMSSFGSAFFPVDKNRNKYL
ncbi:MAG: FAD-dependent thymidylate synthase [Candidatus Omnitrophica bacterium]|nr:FAD-dependent thymidylate synthase [Candidatus Omnitrophota bacterium]